MSEERFCAEPRCGTKLRSHNKNPDGLCGKCSRGLIKHLRPVDGASGDDQTAASPPKKKAQVKKPKHADVAERDTESLDDALAKFHVVAKALGFNSEEVFAQLVTGWMATLGEQVRASQDSDT